ncbi:MAG: hypothetical protein K6V36_09930, partial [Anaerolineae bacterium]|nr:hypothetical protein [Anaerolineae bacterium]
MLDLRRVAQALEAKRHLFTGYSEVQGSLLEHYRRLWLETSALPRETLERRLQATPFPGARPTAEHDRHEPAAVADAVRDLLGASVGGIGLLGVALNQLVDLVNLIERLYGRGVVRQLRAELSAAPAAGALVVPLEGVSVPGPVPAFPPVQTTVYLNLSLGQAPGLGLLGEGERITLTGHSLGGHLAVAAARLLGDRIAPDVYVFNAAGFDPVSVDVVAGVSGLSRFLGPVLGGLLFAAKGALAESLGAGALLLSEGSQRASERILGAIGSLLGGSRALPIVHNVVSEDLAPGDDWSAVASVFTGAGALGPEIAVATEANSHVIEPLLDAAALQG